MTGDLPLQKREMRRQLRAAVKAIAIEDRAKLSQQACDRLRSQQVWQQSKTVLLYSSLPDELDLQRVLCEALADGKTVALPRYVAETGLYEAVVIHDLVQDCTRGYFGILEPLAKCSRISLNRLDLVLVPGVGFDPRGYRLGRGKGFYDRLLAEVTGVKCGIAFNQQITGEIPTEAHDVRLDFILTPSRWLETRESNRRI